jgi:phospholipid/cholesterol/gamma-HCH transport system substrate-binding protein
MLHQGAYPGNPLPGYGHPDQGLPEHPIDPGYGGGIGAPPDPGYDLPVPPPGVWPPPNGTLPIVPAPPGTPPGAIWPPVGNPPVWSGGVNPPHPGGGPAPGRPARPDAGLPPGQPARPDQGLPGASGGTFWIVAGIPGVGWRYVCVDPSLVAGMPLPPAPEPK